MRTNVIAARFGSGRTCRTASVFQYDYGQVLQFVDLELPDVFEAHFARSVAEDAIVTIGQNGEVPVPDAYLTQGGNVLCYIYLHTGDADGETVYTVTIPVAARSAITDAEPTPVQQDVITQTIAALNSGVERAEAAAEEAETAAAEATAFRALFDALGLSVADGMLQQTYEEG